jgi:Glycosyl transferase family 2
VSARAAVVTMVRDEAVFLPIWLGYYSRFFAAEDIYVLDHGTVDGSTDGVGFVCVPVTHPVVDWGWHRDVLQRKQHELLRSYDSVLVTDVDEIVAPDPAIATLRDYLDAFDRPFVTCSGREIIHQPDCEPPFDPTRAVLEQRAWWFANPAYSKPLLAREPMHWHGGMHARVDGAVDEDGVLHLLHLHRMDYELCLARHRQRVAAPWNERDVREGWAYQNRIVEEEAFRHWFHHDSSAGGHPVVPEPIPESWRGVV